MIQGDVRASLPALARRFQDARPFRHVVIEDFLEPAFAARLLAEFPPFDPGRAINEMGVQGRKSVHERIRGLQREYDSHHHEIAGAGNADLTERWELTDFLVDRFGIAGTPEDCRAQIRRAMAAGARQFVITAFVPDPAAFMRRWARDVAAHVA